MKKLKHEANGRRPLTDLDEDLIDLEKEVAAASKHKGGAKDLINKLLTLKNRKK